MSQSPFPSPTDSTLASPPAGPTTEKERIVCLDVLRGFAVLGILVMNIQSFAMISAAYLNPTAFGSLEGREYYVWLLSHLLADQKFMTIFSLLFGGGIVMMAQRRRSTGRSPAVLHYRRMGWLLIIGLLHAYLLWYGDILVCYAWCGCIVFVFRRLPCWLLLSLGIISIGVGSACYAFMGFTMPYWPEQQVHQMETDFWSPAPEKIDEEIRIYRGPWLEQMPHRAASAFFFETFLFVMLTGWRAGGLMLVGMALYRWDVLTGRRSVGLYAAFAILGAALGIPIVLHGVARNFACEWRITYSFFLGGQYNYWGSLLISASYIGLVMLVCQFQRLAIILRPLAAVGRMALTNYLLQTLICTTIFYGHGLGQFARFSRVEQLGTVIAIWVFQLMASPIWLHNFRFGPFEWLWRSLSYWQLQPIWK